MEWAFRVDATTRGFKAQVQTGASSCTVDLTRLVSGGLPRERKAKLIVNCDLKSATLADPNEYLRGFGIALSSADRNLHTVYETKCDGRRLLIPALVLMRMLFRPTRYLLPVMFGPQALDQVRLLDFGSTPPNVEFLRPTWRNLGHAYADLATPISWLSAFPTAMECAGSVHANARAGRIAVSLPSAHARIAFRGRRIRGVLLVTTGELLELHATEEPAEWAAGHSSRIFARATHMLATTQPAKKIVDIPSRPDGGVDLTDAEWEILKPILHPSGQRKRSRHEPRALFDGILRKFLRGTGWKATEYPTGTATNALHAYRRWRNVGALDTAFDALRQCRSLDRSRIVDRA